jgi:hypothetical protein
VPAAVFLACALLVSFLERQAVREKRINDKITAAIQKDPLLKLLIVYSP